MKVISRMAKCMAMASKHSQMGRSISGAGRMIKPKGEGKSSRMTGRSKKVFSEREGSS